MINLPDVHAHKPEADSSILYGRKLHGLQVPYFPISSVTNALSDVSAHNVPAAKHVAYLHCASPACATPSMSGQNISLAPLNLH